ncbi:MAG: hypothetical protein IAX21_00570 [Candidatus Bathyarchaeota archaeon]|nr:hypothetical protein [Candidatus Bathyarchaeum tardum]WNZ29397.1 MAG: hypothetical protein IAX21_00570 [Candidatus Bathyarchaeota archaeon]
MITTGMSTAHSAAVRPKKMASCGAKNNNQKYATIVTKANARSIAPKDLFLNCFNSSTNMPSR